MSVELLSFITLLTSGVFAGAVHHHLRAKTRWAGELAAANSRARTDPLTGLPNREGLLQELDVRIHSSQPWSLIMLDLDGFKPVNDTLGHSGGDVVLMTIADRLKAGAGAQSFVARLGGDEFVLVIPDPAQVAVQVVKRIAHLVSRPQEYQGWELCVGISAGVAGYETGLGSCDLIRRADEAMYRAKEQRRARNQSGQVVLYKAHASRPAKQISEQAMLATAQSWPSRR